MSRNTLSAVNFIRFRERVTPYKRALVGVDAGEMWILGLSNKTALTFSVPASLAATALQETSAQATSQTRRRHLEGQETENLTMVKLVFNTECGRDLESGTNRRHAL